MAEEIKKMVVTKGEYSKFYEELSKKSLEYPEPSANSQRPIGAQPVESPKQSTGAKVKKS